MSIIFLLLNNSLTLKILRLNVYNFTKYPTFQWNSIDFVTTIREDGKYILHLKYLMFGILVDLILSIKAFNYINIIKKEWLFFKVDIIKYIELIFVKWIRPFF